MNDEHSKDMLVDSDDKVPGICQTSTRTWNVNKPPKMCFEFILEPLLGEVLEILILITIASPLFEVPMEGNVVELVEAPHHEVQWIQAKSTNTWLWCKIVEDALWFGHLGGCGTTNPALTISYEIFVTPYDLGLSY